MALSACTELPREGGRELLQLAREAIQAGLDGAPAPPVPDSVPGADASGVFVTLKLDGKLRGCIGVTENAGPLPRAVQECALGAAFRDPRFPPLGAEEFPRVRISISLLSPPSPVAADSRAGLLAQLVPGEDGLILEEGRHRATFLPQVWEQLPQPEEFLRHLLLKAGLPGDYWSPGLRFERYRGVSLAEPDTPGR